MSEQKIKHPGFVIMSNPSCPGIAMVRIMDENGHPIFHFTVDLDCWNKMDSCVRDSLAKYAMTEHKQ